MIIWGITALTHDAALSVIKDGEILFAAHAERYSKIKQDRFLNQEIINEALTYGEPESIAFYENRWIKKWRQLRSGQLKYAFDMKAFPSYHLKKFGINKPIISVKHHLSHAAAGFYTSPFKEATIVVIDSIGEWNTITIWKGNNTKIKLLKKVDYPSSIGLLYSAFTKRCGLKPNEEEYILMGMASYGLPIYYNIIHKEFIYNKGLFSLKNKVDNGINNFLPNAKIEDLAASIQKITEDSVLKIILESHRLNKSENLVYMGGVALNCVVNTKIKKVFDNMWIMPNPGDAGSSLGCAAYISGNRINWKTPYLGTNIEGKLNMPKACTILNERGILGIAKGRAEFGPRALGNRSLLADPRFPEMKDKVNEIKKRQKFRPFAPAILAEHAKYYFDVKCDSPYMQYTFKCKHPKKFPAICHVDETSRIQMVYEKDNPMFHNLLTQYYNQTGCPMLLNTSLNVKGKPIVNDWKDAEEFAKTYGVEVL